MKVRELMRHLIEMDADSDVCCVNINDSRDETVETSTVAADVTSVAEMDDSIAIYYIGDRPKDELEDDVVVS